MNLQLSRNDAPVEGVINITGSKSESNRLLILQALYPEIEIKNLSNSDDSQVLQKALASGDTTVDIHHAGTAMRFLTAYFAAGNREVILTGSERMQQRPIEILVNALRDLGADIEYVKNEGFPPLRIKGKKLLRSKVSLQANVSSQYISALMLIAPSLSNGLEINLEGKTTSVPYIKMTLSLLKNAGFSGTFDGNNIKIDARQQIEPVTLAVESDWSSASYFYSIAALSEKAEILLSSYKRSSNQGDAVVEEIYQKLGVMTAYAGDKVTLLKNGNTEPGFISLDLADSPDLAQTIATTCFGLGVECELTGLHTLKIKETDRLEALKTEIEKMGGKVDITNDSLKLYATKNFNRDVKIATYNDHRMAMAFAPLAMRVPVKIEDAGVVSKSFPGFWDDMEKLGFSCKKEV
ncbi:3-phosphoshikimate 1-carboxyvinyltransferase [Salinimicrobium marinum]|uniref:3-phosphoshikimate 1-carboxyvinyltransferase n=1 Tax=Salinimicrobium marinum TaxID=680283 RepID=A0A918VUH1_9FLAO|nr:3-phosphoshikimate 1-carboxyvinyltransferase [Salinimicrobium marinum]GHA26746.1 3-phosphoshikimate 1-carboxyvinyltransferase [Salinimicrobium marinum]